jgi:amino acid permease
LLLLISAWATSSSIELLVETYDRLKVSTYEKAVEKSLGVRCRKVVEISILVFCCGTAVGYVIAVGDIIERVVPFLTRSQKQVAMSCVWLVAMLPLSCLKKMKSLECASSVGIISIGTLLVAAIVHLVHDISNGGGSDGGDVYFYGLEDDYNIDDHAVRITTTTNHQHHSYDDSDSEYERPSISSLLGPAGGSWLSVLQACPIFFYAFSSQVNVAQIFEELPGRHGNNPQKIRTMGNVTLLGVLVCGLLYASLSLVTLIDFGKNVQPNILSCYDLGSGSSKSGGQNNRNNHQPLLHVAFLGMALAVVIAFPLNIFPARVSLIQMWDEKNNNNDDYEESSQSPSSSSSPPQLLSDTEGIRQPLLSKETRGHRSVGYDSGVETDENNTNNNTNDPNHDEDPLRIISQRAIVSGDSDSDESNNENDYERTTEELFCAQHVGVTLLLAGLALGLALIVPNISVVFGLLGGTTSSLLGFVVPGLLGLQIDRTRISAWILVIFGSIIGVLTTGATVHSMFP